MSKYTLPFMGALPGERRQGYIRVPGTKLRLPYTCIRGEQEGKTAFITSGMHGSEYAAIETANRLRQCLTPAQITGDIIIAGPVNMSAFYDRISFVMPEDERNLNREFPGKAEGSISQKLAKFLMEHFIKKSDLYIDLHSGDIHESLTPMVFYPVKGEEEVLQKGIAAVKALGFRYAAPALDDGCAISAAAAAGVPAILTEMGGNANWTDGEVLMYTEGILRVLTSQGIFRGDEPVYSGITWTTAVESIVSDEQGCWYPCFKPGQYVKKGEPLGEIRDFFDKSLQVLAAPYDCVVLYQINSLAACKGEQLIVFAAIA